MALESQQHIPHAVHDVVTAYATEDFHRHLASKVRSELTSFEVSGSPSGACTITSKQSMSADSLPDIAKKVIRGSVNVTIEETWSAPDADGNRESDINLSVSGAPVKAYANQKLVAQSASSTEATVHGELEVKIPLIGNKVKSAAEPYIERFINLQAKEVSAYLSR